MYRNKRFLHIFSALGSCSLRSQLPKILPLKPCITPGRDSWKTRVTAQGMARMLAHLVFLQAKQCQKLDAFLLPGANEIPEWVSKKQHGRYISWILMITIRWISFWGMVDTSLNIHVYTICPLESIHPGWMYGTRGWLLLGMLGSHVNEPECSSDLLPILASC